MHLRQQVAGVRRQTPVSQALRGVRPYMHLVYSVFFL
ncbi:hypothetical protein Barb4_04099 [Bacteroidales bacterium Barb4]|nr:hypothetical protein Barb4_04099 [Bacteroidales bacterium Barb4]